MLKKLLTLLVFLPFFSACSDDSGNDGPTGPDQDLTLPSSAVQALPAQTRQSPFTVTWTGTDAESGIQHYDLQWKDGDGPWEDALQATTSTSQEFHGVDGHTYSFRSRAMDKAGNQEPYPPGADAVTLMNLGPDLTWEATIAGDRRDGGTGVMETSDGGFAVVGLTESSGAGGSDAYLIKYSSAGQVEWEKTYGGERAEFGWSVLQTSDGGFALAGYTESFGAQGRDAYLVRTDAAGELVWQKTFGGIAWDHATCLVETSDGGFVAAGQTRSPALPAYDAYVFKVTSDGDPLWTLSFGGADDENITGLAESSDGSLFLSGTTRSYGVGSYDGYAARVSADGNLVWEQAHGTDGVESFEAMDLAADGGVVLAGLAEETPGAQEDLYIVKLDTDGGLVWEWRLGGETNEAAYAVQVTPEGEIVVAGAKDPPTSTADLGYLARISSDGTLLWERTYGGSATDYFLGLALTSGNGYIMTGTTESSGVGGRNLWVVRTRHP